MGFPAAENSNIAIIGATGAGKTTLAVGLYATSTGDFTVSPVGDVTSRYLEIRKTSIEEGFWPAAGLEADNVELRLNLHASGNQMDIVFREYMGERMERDPNYIREVVGTPKTAMILFNPGMPALSQPEARNRMLGNLKVIAQHLKDCGTIAVAFVVTASDRLESDLAPFMGDFETYASEVTNHLTNLGLDWKRFDVTVSGQLDDQNRPRLARGENNTTHKPFLWLLKRIRDRNRRKRLLAAAAVAATFLGVSGVIFGGLVIRSRQVISRAEATFDATADALQAAYARHDEAEVRTTSEFFKTNSFERLRAILPSDKARRQGLIDRAREEGDLYTVRLLELEFASNAKKAATRPLEVPLVWFEDFNRRLSMPAPAFPDAAKEREALANEWDLCRGKLETASQTAHLNDEVKKACDLLSAVSDQPVDALRKSRELLEKIDGQFRLADEERRFEAKGAIAEKRREAIGRYIECKAKWMLEAKNPPADKASLENQLRKEFKSALMDEEFEDIMPKLEECRRAAREAWEANQKRLVEDFDFNRGIYATLEEYGKFIDEYPSNPYLDTMHDRMESRLTEYFEGYIGNYRHTFLGERNWFDDPQSMMGKADRDFDEFRRVCTTIAGKWLGTSPLCSRRVGKFARLCVDRGKLDTNGFLSAFEQHYRITKVEVKFNHTSLDSDCRCLALKGQVFLHRWSANSGGWELVANPVLFSRELDRNDFGDRWVTVSSGAVDVFANPFMLPILRLDYADRMTDISSINQEGAYWRFLDFAPGTQSVVFYDDVCMEHSGFDSNNAGRLSLRVIFEGSGADFQSLWDEAK